MQKPKISFVTSNKNKFLEAREIIPRLEQMVRDLDEIQELDPRKIIEHKNNEVFKYYPEKSNLVVEDTSLYFDCLNRLPGPLIKWFLQEIGNKGLYELANNYGEYGAEAKTFIGYAVSPKEVYFFEGSVRGQIVEPSGETEFGWDPLFLPNGYRQTFAEMSKEEKNEISHRTKAFMKLKEFLESVQCCIIPNDSFFYKF